MNGRRFESCNFLPYCVAQSCFSFTPDDAYLKVSLHLHISLLLFWVQWCQTNKNPDCLQAAGIEPRHQSLHMTILTTRPFQHRSDASLVFGPAMKPSKRLSFWSDVLEREHQENEKKMDWTRIKKLEWEKSSAKEWMTRSKAINMSRYKFNWPWFGQSLLDIEPSP